MNQSISLPRTDLPTQMYKIFCIFTSIQVPTYQIQSTCLSDLKQTDQMFPIRFKIAIVLYSLPFDLCTQPNNVFHVSDSTLYQCLQLAKIKKFTEIHFKWRLYKHLINITSVYLFKVRKHFAEKSGGLLRLDYRQGCARATGMYRRLTKYVLTYLNVEYRNILL